MSRFDASLIERALRLVGRPPAAEALELVDLRELALPLLWRLVESFEGFSSHAYLCPAGVATIGYGSTRYLDGRRVTLADPPLSRQAARRLVERVLVSEVLPRVLKLCPGIETAGQLAALADFEYNCGALAASTLRRVVNASDWARVPEQLRRWVHGRGRVLPGLVARREAEVTLLA